MKQNLLAPAVLVDVNEPADFAEALGSEFRVIRKRLDVGDYVIGGIIVERKSKDDLFSSITDGRLFSQAERMLEHGRAVLLLEGKSERLEPSLKAGVLARLILKGVSTVCTESKEESKEFLKKLAKKTVEREQSREFIGKKPKSIEEQRLFVLMSLPGVGRKIAEELLEEFGSIEAISKATVEDLKKVKNLGEKKARRILAILRG